jgi:SAM-dependent MidA family methyltransferase
LIVINNELFDAIPIIKFAFHQGQWCEILIDNDLENSKSQAINFKYTFSPPNNENVKKYLKPEVTFAGVKIKEGETYEFSPERIYLIKNL